MWARNKKKLRSSFFQGSEGDVVDSNQFPDDIDTYQDYADIVGDNETLKLRNRKLTNEMDKLNSHNKNLVTKTKYLTLFFNSGPK